VELLGREELVRRVETEAARGARSRS
jgi:hypothetical protein